MTNVALAGNGRVYDVVLMHSYTLLWVVAHGFRNENFEL